MRYQDRNNGMVCRTIDSLMGEFCYNCGARPATPIREAQGLDYCLCEHCAEAQRLDERDMAAMSSSAPTEEEWRELCQRISMFRLDRVLAMMRAEKAKGYKPPFVITFQPAVK